MWLLNDSGRRNRHSVLSGATTICRQILGIGNTKPAGAIRRSAGKPRLGSSIALVALLAAAPAAASERSEWQYQGGSLNYDRYSPLDIIDKDNVANLKILWRRPAIDESLTKKYPDLNASPYFKGSPIIVGRTLYSPNGIGLVEAFDAVTGKTKWVQQPFAATMKEAAGQSSRGAAYWAKGGDARIIVIRGDYLYALNAETGAYLPAFGRGGRVMLRRQTRDNSGFEGTNGPIVVGDVIVVSGGGGGDDDAGNMREATPENIRGYDVRTGALLWTFNVLPQAGEPGNETWPEEAATYVGAMGAWAGMSADEKLGYVYLPLTSPGSAWYGGHRKGDNLYANSLVVLDAKTGKRVWHFQMIHHDLWDWDNASPPTLGTINVGGRRIDAVIQPNKSGYLFVFDRKTGKPVWPIEERPVPQSNVPGEYSSPTQPIPTKPENIDRTSISEDDLIDFTPELRAEAKKIIANYDLAPIFTPPRVYGSGKPALTVPGAFGSGQWNSGAFDPQTGIYYAVSMTRPDAIQISKPTEKGSTIGYSLAFDTPNSPPTYGAELSSYGIGPKGLPLLKPPYGRITAFDMNKGEKLWMVANGDGPRNHPELKDLKLPPLGTTGRPVPLVTKSLLFLGESSDAVMGNAGVPGVAMFRAYDKATGAVVSQLELPSGTTGSPMTYAVDGQQLIVVPIGNRANGAEWVAMGIGK